MVKISKRTLQELREIINERSEYRRGIDLVEFFNELGFSDSYDENFPSRSAYTDEKLEELANKNQVSKAVKSVFAPVNFVGRIDQLQELVKEFNDYLYYDGFNVIIHRNSVEICEVSVTDEVLFPTHNTTIRGNTVNIQLHPSIYNHVKRNVENGDYFHAVEEAYKVVRERLKELTGEEQAHKAFAESNYKKIFGSSPQNGIEKDFFEAVKYLNMSIQKFRNEKAHSLAYELNENLALHYLTLASLALDLISRNDISND